MKEEAEIYYTMRAASGRMVRVPASKLQEWMDGQEDIAKEQQPDENGEGTTKNSKKTKSQKDD